MAWNSGVPRGVPTSLCRASVLPKYPLPQSTIIGLVSIVGFALSQCPSQVYPLSQSTIIGLVTIVGFALSQCPSQVCPLSQSTIIGLVSMVGFPLSQSPSQLYPLSQSTIIGLVSTPGPSGLTAESLRLILDDEEATNKLIQVTQQIARAELPDTASQALGLGRLVALQKPNGRVRGLVIGDLLRRLVARSLAQQFSQHIQQACSPHQYALSTRAGTEAVVHVITSATELDPNNTIVSVDGIGAYDTIARHSMLQALQAVPEAHRCLPFVRLFYAQPSTYVWHDGAPLIRLLGPTHCPFSIAKTRPTRPPSSNTFAQGQLPSRRCRQSQKHSNNSNITASTLRAGRNWQQAELPPRTLDPTKHIQPWIKDGNGTLPSHPTTASAKNSATISTPPAKPCWIPSPDRTPAARSAQSPLAQTQHTNRVSSGSCS